MNRFGRGFPACAALPLLCFACAAAEVTVPLNVGAGVPLRLYLTKRISKRAGDPVRAKVIEPVFAFDREVIPAGSEVIGRVSRLDPLAKMKRTSAVIGGDFTPLRQAQVEFTQLVLPDGRRMALRTVETTGLISLFDPRPPKKQKAAGNPGTKPGILGTGRQQIQTQVKGQINARTRGVADLVHGPDKKDRLEEFLIAKLPYHPQWVRKGTRFDAVLRDPLAFGTATVNTDALKEMGTQPPSDSVVHARLLARLDSGTAKLGQPLEAVVSQPLFSAANLLILPAGSRLTGTVTLVHRARWFHRGGQIRFSFQKIDLPADAVQFATPSTEPIKIMAKLEAAEGGKMPIKVDEEGGVKTDEPKTRLIAPAISVLIAARTLDNDEGRRGVHDGESNTGGRSLGGFSGFGLLGTLAAQSSRNVGSALGFYGMAVSVYTNIIARGAEIEFADNAAMDIRFGSRPPATAPAAKKLKTQAFSKSSAAEFMQ
ncbi:MAG: hypothetical protein ACR2I2_14185 [Bryobacteraceae bacterium]